MLERNNNMGSKLEWSAERTAADVMLNGIVSQLTNRKDRLTPPPPHRRQIVWVGPWVSRPSRFVSTQIGASTQP